MPISDGIDYMSVVGLTAAPDVPQSLDRFTDKTVERLQERILSSEKSASSHLAQDLRYLTDVPLMLLRKPSVYDTEFLRFDKGRLEVASPEPMPNSL